MTTRTFLNVSFSGSQSSLGSLLPPSDLQPPIERAIENSETASNPAVAELGTRAREPAKTEVDGDESRDGRSNLGWRKRFDMEGFVAVRALPTPWVSHQISH